VRPRHGHNWDDRPFFRDDETGDAGAQGVYGGGVINSGTTWEAREAQWSRPMPTRQKLAGKRKTLAGSFA
jgi:hypothetical protein